MVDLFTHELLQLHVIQLYELLMMSYDMYQFMNYVFCQPSPDLLMWLDRLYTYIVYKIPPLNSKVEAKRLVFCIKN
jgi:hypothetical protein